MLEADAHEQLEIKLDAELQKQHRPKPWLNDQSYHVCLQRIACNSTTAFETVLVIKPQPWNYEPALYRSLFLVLTTKVTSPKHEQRPIQKFKANYAVLG